MGTMAERLAIAVLEGDCDRTPSLVQEALGQGLAPKEILDHGLIAAMNEVGNRFKCGEMFVPEVLTSADAMQAGLQVLRPLLMANGTRLAGKIVMATVKGDLHDIGKNLVAMMCEGAGFEVVDLGCDVDPAAIVMAVKEHRPDIVGMSALLTTTMRAMGMTIQALQEAGLRDTVKVMVGGAPVDAAFAGRIGADGYGSNAPNAVELAKSLVGMS
jgi:5-methyltetrahydrofolate--homocysteine methyltransferase